jgi:hypothetical protein
LLAVRTDAERMKTVCAAPYTAAKRAVIN